MGTRRPTPPTPTATSSHCTHRAIADGSPDGTILGPTDGPTLTIAPDTPLTRGLTLGIQLTTHLGYAVKLGTKLTTHPGTTDPTLKGTQLTTHTGTTEGPKLTHPQGTPLGTPDPTTDTHTTRSLEEPSDRQRCKG